MFFHFFTLSLMKNGIIMKRLTIFLAGSVNLIEERKALKGMCSKLNKDYEKRRWSTQAISCDELTTQQEGIDKYIKKEADVVIFIVKDKLNPWSRKEMRIAKECRETAGRPAILVMLDKKSGEPHEELLKTYMEGLLGENEYYVPYNGVKSIAIEARKKIEPILKSETGNILENAAAFKKNEQITWYNDNFAYLTIEVRFKENYNIAMEETKELPQDFSYHEILNKHVLTDTSAQMNEVLEEAIQTVLRSVNIEYNDHTHMRFLREVPFLASEFYFYYYILYLYYQINNCNTIEDPYRYYKRKDQENMETKKPFENMCINFLASLESFNPMSENKLKNLIRLCVNMNSSDLSQTNSSVGEIKSTNMPINDTEDFCNFLKTDNAFNRDSTIQLITDNCGQELISDILLGISLLKRTNAQQVVYHIKRLPIFVSDSIMSDVYDAMEVISICRYIKRENGTNIFMLQQNEIGKDPTAESITYQCLFNDGMIKQLVFRVDNCWHLPTLFKDLNIFKDWSKEDNDCALIIVKGDLNYRRLVGDYKYDCDESVRDKTRYIKKPLLILRSLKSNVVLDIPAEKAQELDAQNPNWRTAGDYGIIQFVKE